MTNCSKCSHYHDLQSKLMCDLGLGEVIIIGPMKATMSVDQCQAYDGPNEPEQKSSVINHLMPQGPAKRGRKPKHG